LPSAGSREIKKKEFRVPADFILMLVQKKQAEGQTL
jgi:hypothetical protein